MIYARPQRVLHWLSAVIILGLLWVGFAMTGMDYSPLKIQIYGWHKSFGLLVWGLTFVRLALRHVYPAPAALQTHTAWEKYLSKLVHLVLYGGLLLMPLSGWLMSSAGDFPVSFFGVFDVPDLIVKNKGAFGFFRELHELTAVVLMGALALHMAGAFKHHLIDRDSTLSRMTDQRLSFKAGVFFIVCIFLVLMMMVGSVSFSAGEGIHEENTNHESPLQLPQQSEWIIDQENSRITFEVSQYGNIFTGKFSNFGGTIVFDPDDLAHSYAEITINIASIDTGSGDRDNQARGADWFNTNRFPQARFETYVFEKQDNPKQSEHYIAHGRLSLRGVTRDISVPLEIRIVEKDGIRRATVEGAIILERLMFGVGQGEWASTQAIADAVPVEIYLQAQSR